MFELMLILELNSPLAKADYRGSGRVDGEPDKKELVQEKSQYISPRRRSGSGRRVMRW